jgi:hypothetical protein
MIATIDRDERSALFRHGKGLRTTIIGDTGDAT